MAESVKLINSIDGWTLTRDVDFSLFSKAVSNAWVVEWLSPTQVGWAGTDINIPAWEALVKVTRTSVTPNEIFYVVYRNTSDVILTSWNNKKIFIEIEQTNINTPSNNTSPTGENIGSVKIADNYPSDNFLKLWETDWVWLLSVDVLEFYTIKQQVATKSNYGESNTWNDSYEISIPWINSYFDWLKLEVKADVANTGACTLNVNWLGTKAVKKQQWTVDLIDWDWGINGIATLVYNSTLDVWQFEGEVVNIIKSEVPSSSSDIILWETVSAWDSLYIDSWDSKAYKTDALDSNKINFVWFAWISWILDETIKLNTSWVDWSQSGLIIGSDYYLSQLLVQELFNQVSWWSSGAFDTDVYSKFWQEITPWVNWRLLNFTFNVKKVWNPVNMTCKVYDVTKTILIWTAKNELTNVDVWTSLTEFTFNFSWLILNSWTKYFIEVDMWTTNSSNYYKFDFKNSNVYSWGFPYRWNGSSWASSTTWDMYFKYNISNWWTWIWNISTTPWTNSVKVWKAISSNEILIDTFNNSDLNWEITSIATTWSVVLGNAEWYVTIKINGEDKKIAYFWI